MARFGQQFLANLGNAGGMLQGFSDLGGAIGGVPGQMRDKRILGEEAKELKNSGFDPGTAGYLSIQAMQAARRGNKELATKYGALAQQAKDSATTLRLAQAKAGRDEDANVRAEAKEERELITHGQSVLEHQQGQTARNQEILGKRAQSLAVIGDLQQALKTKKNLAGEKLSDNELKSVHRTLVNAARAGDSAHTLGEARDALLGKKEVVKVELINFVNKQGVFQYSVLASDTKGIDKALEAGLAEGNRVSPPSGGFEMVSDGQGGFTMRLGGTGRTVGSNTRDQGLDQQTNQLQGLLDATRDGIANLRNPERAFGLQGWAIDSSVVGTLMQLPAGEVAVETLASIIGKPISSEEAASIKAVRSQLHNLISNARSVTKGIQSTRGASVTEKELAAKVIRGLEAKDDLKAVMASLEAFQELLTLRKAAVGRNSERIDPLPELTDDELKAMLRY